MSLSLPQEVFDQIAREDAHSPSPRPRSSRPGSAVPRSPARVVRDGTREGLQRATPVGAAANMLMLNDALGVLSSGQRMFQSAMVSFYNAREGGAMLKRCGFEGCPTSAASIWSGARSTPTWSSTTTVGEPASPSHSHLFSNPTGTRVPPGRVPPLHLRSGTCP